MKNKTQLVLMGMLCAFFSHNIQSQTISQVMNDPDLNYFEKIDLVENSGLKSASITTEWELKRYHHYRTFWDSRIDANDLDRQKFALKQKQQIKKILNPGL